jgi:hypothetical protein
MSDVTVRFRGDTSNLDRALRNVNRGMKGLQKNSKSANRSLQGIQKSSMLVSGALKTAALALGAFAVGKGIQGVIQATTTFEGFRAQLTAYLGDQRAANAELARLEELATGLPQSLQDLTHGFTVLTREGIGTANKEMKAFANIASANNKTLGQLAEALGDATRGEFERIKEFGVKVNKDGDKFVATFQGQTLAVEDSAIDIVNSIRKIGEKGGTFYGAAESQANTLTGAMSRMGDSVQKAFRTIGEGGLATAIAEVADRMSKFLDNNKKLMKDIGEGLAAALYAAADGAKFLLENIEYVGYAVGALIALGLTKSLFGIATMILSVVGPAVVMLSKALLGLATMVIKTLIRGALGLLTVAFGKIILVTGLVAGAAYGLAKAWDWVFGTSMGDSIDGFAKGAMDKVKEVTNSISTMTSDFVADGVEWYNTTDLMAAGTTILGNSVGLTSNAWSEYKRQAAAARAATDDTTKGMDEAGIAAHKLKMENERLAAAYDAVRLAVKSASAASLDALTQEADLLRIKLSLQGKSDAAIEAGIALKKEEVRFRKANKKALEGEVQAHLQAFRSQLNENAAIKDNIILREEQKALLEQSISDGKKLYEDLNPLAVLEEQRKADLKNLEAYHRSEKSSVNKQLRDKEALERNHAQRLTELKQQKYDEDLKMSGINNSEITGLLSNFHANSEQFTQGGIKAVQAGIGSMGTLFEQLGKHNKDAFNAAKAFNIANAIMNTAMGITKALSTLPVPFNFIAAAAVGAAGFAQVAAIRSQQYTGRQLGGPVQEGKSFLVGETGPEIFTPNASGRIDRMDSLGGQNVNINFNIQAVDTQGFDELLVSRRGVIQQVISDAMLESGQRSRY